MGLIDARMVRDTDNVNISDKLVSLSKVQNEYEWTNVAAGKLIYNLPNGAVYDPNSKWLEVMVGGAPVQPSLIKKDSPTQFTLLVPASAIPAGINVVARWVETFVPATSGHSAKHELGGADEIDITKLKNFNIMSGLITPTTSVADRQTILSNNYHVTFAAGTYSIDQVIAITRSHTKITFVPGVTFVVNTDLNYIFSVDANLKNIELHGSNTIIDLNNKANGFFSCAKNTAKQENYIIKGFKVMNKDVPYKFTAALYLKHLRNFAVEDFSVDNYSRLVTQSTSAYGIGLFDCEDGYLSKIRLSKSYIGLLTQNVYNIKFSEFNITDMLDNGIYFLENVADAPSGFSISKGLVDQCEEGIVSYLTDLTIDDVVIRKSTNKGITLRKGINVTVSKCTFRENGTDIGDDNTNSITESQIINNNFYDSKVNAINLVRMSRTKIKDNLFKSNVITGTMVRIIDEGSQGNENEISYNRFDSTSQTATLLSLTSYQTGILDNLIAYNRFLNAGVGIKLLRSGGTGIIGTKLSKNIYSNVATKKSISGGVVVTDEDYA